MGKKRILLFAEAVTLAHLARPLALIEQLTKEEWDVHLACPNNCFQKILDNFNYPIHTLECMSPTRFKHALDWGLPIFTENLLARYISQDLRLIEKLQPDVVVGDFRLSLSVSARVAGVRYINITNAYWRPEWLAIPPYPCLKPLKWVPTYLVEPVFRKVISRIFSVHAQPFNALRRRYGLGELPSDVRYFYTDGDTILYADIQDLYPALDIPKGHSFLGPLLWAPKSLDPPWWNDLPSDKPVIYLVAGSSGNSAAFKRVIEYLREMPVNIMAAIGGCRSGSSGNIYYAPWLNGIKAARRAALIISNGGVMSCHQALAAEIPVLGICANMDQFLSMMVMENESFGLCVRQDQMICEDVRAMVVELLNKKSPKLSLVSRKISEFL